MKILVLSNNEVVEWQGAGYVIANTSKSLRTLGHTVDIIPPLAFSFLSGLKAKAVNHRMAVGMALWVINHKKRILAYDLLIFYTAESSLALFILKKIFRVNTPTLLHSNGLEVHADYTLAKYAPHFLGKKKWYHFNKSWLFTYCYKNVTAIITTSLFEKDFAVSQLGIPASDVFVLEPCLPNIFFESPIHFATSKKNIITFCGAWIARKGVDSIQKVIPDVLRKYPEYIFRIIGAGDDFNLKNHFPEDVQNRIETFPRVGTKEKIMQLFAESSIFLFPSIYESFGLVVTEAMYCRCAVISGPTGIAASIKNNEEAIILAIPNATNISNSIEMLITNHELREKIAENGRARTQNLRWSVYSQKLDLILQSVLPGIY